MKRVRKTKNQLENRKKGKVDPQITRKIARLIDIIGGYCHNKIQQGNDLISDQEQKKSRK